MTDLRRLSLAAALLTASLVAPACAQDQGTEDDTGESGNAALSANDLLGSCPVLEEQLFEAEVNGDAMIRQSNRIGGYKLDDGTEVPATQETNPAPATALYSLRFYRDAQGKTKFQFAIGTFAGVAQNIEGATKRLVGSGTVTFQRGNSYGELVFTSRRDGLEGVVGPVSKVRFSGLVCDADDARISLDVPIVTLDKASDETVVIDSGIAGGIRVSKSVKWAKKASSAPLAFDVPKG